MQVREETAKLSHVRQLLYDYLRAGKTWKAPRTLQTSCRRMLTPCTVKVAKGREARVKVKTKVTDTTAKVKVNCQSNSDTLTVIAISVVNTDTRNQTVRAGTDSSMARVTSVEHMDTRELTVLLKRWHIWNPNLWLNQIEEPTEIESLEWLYSLEYDGEAMASLTDALVRLLLDSGSGVSACSPEFAPHVKTLTGVNMEVLKISKPIVSTCKMVRSGRRIVSG